MSEVMPEEYPVRCSGCGFSHTECLSQQEAVRFIHRAVELLEHLEPWSMSGVSAVLDEYREKWL